MHFVKNQYKLKLQFKIKREKQVTFTVSYNAIIRYSKINTINRILSNDNTSS